MHKMDSQAREPIAIVGSSCRLPGGANTPAELWDLLQNPRDVLSVIPPDRFNTRAFYNHDGDHHGVSEDANLIRSLVVLTGMV